MKDKKHNEDLPFWLDCACILMFCAIGLCVSWLVIHPLAPTMEDTKSLVTTVLIAVSVVSFILYNWKPRVLAVIGVITFLCVIFCFCVDYNLCANRHPRYFLDRHEGITVVDYPVYRSYCNAARK